MSISLRDPPDGYTSNQKSGIWCVGYVFEWSSVFDCWLDRSERLTVKPGQTCADAYEKHAGEPLFGKQVFFILE